jgi:hypothetical protein
MVRSNKLRGPRRVPEALVLLLAAVEAGDHDLTQAALAALRRRMDGVTDLYPARHRSERAV